MLKEANTFGEKCNAFISTLFPTPKSIPIIPCDIDSEEYTPSQNNWEWPDLQAVEVERAINSSNPKKAPGDDSIGFKIIQQAFKANPTPFILLYQACFKTGYHPTPWRESIGIILPKPNKVDYSIPKVYRIINLLKCIGKVLEKIYTTRLGYLANTTTLLHNSQIGRRQQRSAIDAALLLLHQINLKRAQAKKKKPLVTTTCFLDIKGAFDHINKHKLLNTLKKLNLPTLLIRWVGGFLSKRRIKLMFENQIQESTRIDTRIPQGSPISPILFLIYVRGLVQDTVYQLSYIDDFTLAYTSTSAKQNCKVLAKVIEELFKKASNQGIAFDSEKTKLIHFSNKQEPILTTINIS